MIHRFHPEALDEWHAASLRYEVEQRGLGVEFVEAIRAAVGVVMAAPMRWPSFTRNTRAYRLDRFPYRLVYAVLEVSDEVLIVSIMHTSRDGGYVERRLR